MTEKELMQIPCDLSSYRAMSHRSLRLQFDTQENLTDEQVAKITAQHEKRGWLCFLVSDTHLVAEDLLDLPELPNDPAEKYTPAQRQRHIIYRIWEKQGKQGTEQEHYYILMDKINTWLKQKFLE